jgi:hypothetical protein
MCELMHNKKTKIPKGKSTLTYTSFRNGLCLFFETFKRIINLPTSTSFLQRISFIIDTFLH